MSLNDFRGQPVILAFYPADWSPVCTDQLSLYAMVMPEFKKFNAELLAISVDNIWSHLAFVKDRKLNFPVLVIRWSHLSPDGINPGADGILSALENLGKAQVTEKS